MGKGWKDPPVPSHGTNSASSFQRAIFTITFFGFGRGEKGERGGGKGDINPSLVSLGSEKNGYRGLPTT